MRLSLFLVVGLSLMRCVSGQTDYLTVREAESIVSQIPIIRAAEVAGLCPIFSSAYDGGPDEVSFRARYGCGPSKGELIADYRVRRSDGTVVSWGDNPELISDPGMRKYAERLVLRARKGALTVEEARCLAVEAAKSLPGWNGEGSKVSVDALDTVGGGQWRFTAHYHDSIHPGDSDRDLTVDSHTALVRDDATGQQVMSQRVGALMGDILDLRAAPLLTDQDSVLIALAIPGMRDQASNGCRLYSAGPFRPDETEIGVACGPVQKEGATGLIVNVRTAQTFRAGTKIPLESAESIHLGKELLERRRLRQVELRKRITSVCSNG